MLTASGGLERRAEARLNDAWLAEARTDAQTLYLLMNAGAALVRDAAPGASTVMLVDGTDPRVAAIDDAEPMVLLGWFRGCRCVLLDLPPPLATTRAGERFAELRPLSAELAADEAGLVAYARALNLWRLNHRYCGRCGAPTVATRAGHARRCSQCGTLGFPRLDPAVIVLVHDGERVLLGRQPGWPVGRYSALAGFVEPGETLEDAVRREVHEEAGIDVVGDIRYHSSQPWPFPASLMLGFTAKAASAQPVLHDGELEEAHWFTRAELTSGATLLPPQTIARRLIDSWLGAAA